jgi:hypothetical protein
MERSGFPETQVYRSFGKSYLIPETTNSGIGEGIVNYSYYCYSVSLMSEVQPPLNPLLN